MTRCCWVVGTFPTSPAVSHPHFQLQAGGGHSRRPRAAGPESNAGLSTPALALPTGWAASEAPSLFHSLIHSFLQSTWLKTTRAQTLGKLGVQHRPQRRYNMGLGPRGVQSTDWLMGKQEGQEAWAGLSQSWELITQMGVGKAAQRPKRQGEGSRT